MAQSPELDAGAPIARDAIDPDLVKLQRTRPKVGAVTALGVVVLCIYFLVRLGPDRRFAGEPDAPANVAVAEITAGKVSSESFIALDGDPLLANAIRTSKQEAGLGFRITPMRGSGDRVWVALTDGDDQPRSGRYVGRLRSLGEMPFEEAMRSYAVANPRPVFATADAVREGFASGRVKAVSGETITVPDDVTVGFDVIAPEAAQIVVTFNAKTAEHGPLLDVRAWQAELARIGIEATPSPSNDVTRRDEVLRQARFDVKLSVAAVTQKLESAKLWTRVEPVVGHHDVTWKALREGPATALAGVDLVGIYVLRGIPPDAQVLLVGEAPRDYWHVLPVTIVLALIALLFAWALVRAIRELLPTRG